MCCANPSLCLSVHLFVHLSNQIKQTSKSFTVLCIGVKADSILWDTWTVIKEALKSVHVVQQHIADRHSVCFDVSSHSEVDVVSDMQNHRV